MSTILFLIIILGVFWKISVIRPEWIGGLAIVWVILFFICIFWGILRRSERCKVCKTKWAYDEVNRELCKTRPTSDTVYEKKYNTFENRWETVPVKVPATEYKYEVTEKCRNCGNIRRRFEYKIVKDV